MFTSPARTIRPELLSRFERVLRLGVLSAQEGRHVVASPALRQHQFVERRTGFGIVAPEITPGAFDISPQVGGEQQRRADVARDGVGHGVAVRHRNRELPAQGISRAVGQADREIRTLPASRRGILRPQRDMHSLCALIEQQPFGKGVARRIQQQPLHHARRQIGTAEKQSRFPASVVAAVAPAVHHQPQPCGQGSCRQHVHRDESVPFRELQHARRGIRHGEVEALLGARRGAAHCMVGAARLGNHPETAHSRTARPHGVERRAPVVAEHGFDSRRTARIRQGLEGYAARTARHEVTAFGVERHGEIARRGAGPRLRNLARSAAVGGDPKGLAEEVVRTLVPHEARVCREGIVAVRSVRRNGKIARVERIAAEYLDPPHERARFVAEFGIDVAARRHRTVRGGIDAPRTQPDRVSCHIGVLVGVDVALLLRVTQTCSAKGLDDWEAAGRTDSRTAAGRSVCTSGFMGGRFLDAALKYTDFSGNSRRLCRRTIVCRAEFRRMCASGRCGRGRRRSRGKRFTPRGPGSLRGESGKAGQTTSDAEADDCYLSSFLNLPSLSK